MTPAALVEARRALGFTQTQLANALGVTLRAVQHWEGGTRPVPGPVAVAVASMKPRRLKPSAKP